MSESTTIRWEQDETGVVTLVLDDPDQSANTMNQAFKDSIAAVADRAGGREGLHPRHRLHLRQEDLLRRRRPQGHDPAAPRARRRLAFDTGMAIKRALRRIETLGKPVVAAINGAALGGGYEIALACHHRIALDAPGSKIGLPEVTLGLLPAGGGVTRTVRLHGHRRRAAQGPAPGHPVQPAARPGERPGPRTWPPPPRRCWPRPAPSSTPTRSRSSPGTSRATRSPAARRPTRGSPPTCPPSPRT